MIDSQDLNDLQLEDVEDYAADYPPAGFPQAEENIHTSASAAKAPNYRLSTIKSMIHGNKWLVGLLFIIVVVLITIIAIVSGGSSPAPISSSNGGADTDTGPSHQAPIAIDPTTLDPEVTSALMATLVSLYDRHGLNTSVFDDDYSPQKKAFYWMATDDNLDNLDHTQKSQRFALATFYYATNAVPTPYTERPQPWVSAHLWLSKAHVCEWKGILCNTQLHVQAIDLERNNLCGSIPLEITILAGHLVELDLTSNLIYMEGQLFDAFKTLEFMETLLMDDNFLAGEAGLPYQFQNLKNLEKLRLSYNLFAGELESDHKVIANMGKLTHLEIESNFLTGAMPDVIGEMENLVYLYMRRNEMTYNLDFLKAGSLTSLCKSTCCCCEKKHNFSF
jgi:hypothetical protein